MPVSQKTGEQNPYTRIKIKKKRRKKTFGKKFKNIINKMVSCGDYKDCMPFNLLPLL